MKKKVMFLILIIPSVFQAQKMSWENEKVSVHLNQKSHTLLDASSLYKDRWDILPQAMFWKEIMLLSPDSCIINVASSRKILDKTSLKQWAGQTENQKTAFKDSLRCLYNLASDERIFITSGKNDFYRFNEVFPTISQGVRAFERLGVDPWYAQAILLIESPAQLKKSTVGAYGPFQLMPSVARSHGLTVTEQVDERADFERSAYAASQLIKTVCIPEAKKILNKQGIVANESDLWFRLFVLHVYHAGASNVQAVVAKIKPVNGSQELIKQMWQTTAGGFGNNSQNYSQLALAAQLILEELVNTLCDDLSAR